jgi:hypothetical protein
VDLGDGEVVKDRFGRGGIAGAVAGEDVGEDDLAICWDGGIEGRGDGGVGGVLAPEVGGDLRAVAERVAVCDAAGFGQ